MYYNMYATSEHTKCLLSRHLEMCLGDYWYKLSGIRVGIIATSGSGTDTASSGNHFVDVFRYSPSPADLSQLQDTTGNIPHTILYMGLSRYYVLGITIVKLSIIETKKWHE